MNRTAVETPEIVEADRLAGFDFTRHNAEVQVVWEAYNAGRPFRTPIILGLNTRFFMAHPDANWMGMDFQRYLADPDAKFETQLRFARWSRFNMLQDQDLGLPEVWQIHVDFQNCYEAAWFGCRLAFYDGQVPDTRPDFANCPERVMERGIPRPFHGFMQRGWEFYHRFQERAGGEEYLGRPISVYPPWFGIGTDGPMTAACNLFGPEFVCTAMAVEPGRLHRLLDFITEATIRRMDAWRRLAGVPTPQDGFIMADDSIALISTAMYREHVLPYHRRIYDTFGTRAGRGIHLCGDATRHFPTLKEELGIEMFDTGFPVDFGRLRRELGPGVRIQGGPSAELVRAGTPAEVRSAVCRVMQSGVLEGGLFVLREGNNLAPGTPLENTEALYAAGRELGRLTEERWTAD